MIKGIGYDLVEIERIAAALEKSERFAKRLLTEREREYCLTGKLAAERTAGRFAAKEAVAKALGRSFSWQEVEILPDQRGRPVVFLHRRAFDAAKGGTLMVSITHTRQQAAAIAMWVVGEQS